MKLCPMLPWKGHIGEHILFGTVHKGGEFRHLRPDLVGDIAPLGACGLCRVLGTGRADEGRDDATSALSGMDQGIAHEVNPASPPGGREHFRHGCLDAPVNGTWSNTKSGFPSIARSD